MQRVAFFRPGTHRSAAGREVTLTAEDLAAAAAAYDPALHAAPLVLGHPATDAPAYGRIGRLEYVEADGLIYATDLQNLDAAFSGWVEEGRYDRVSVSWYPPEHPDNPKPGTWYPRHLGFLGAHPPALKGLPAPEFAAETEGLVTLEFAEPAASAWALRGLLRLFRRFRDFVAEERGAEEAERLLPGHELDGLLEEVAREEGRAWEQERQAGAHGFSEDPNPQPEKVMDPTEFAEREQALQQREAELAAQQEAFEQQRRQAEEAAAARARAEFTEFAQGLTREGGRLRPDEQAVVVEALCALDRLDRQAGAAATVEFAAAGGSGEGAEQKPLIGEVKRLLGRLGPQVPVAEVAPDGERTAPTEDFSAPAGYAVDSTALDVHRKALAYQAEHQVDYVAAVRAVS